MGSQTTYTRHAARPYAGVELSRVIVTLIGSALVIGCAFLNWSRGLTGDHTTDHSLYQQDFAYQSDIVRTIGGIAILLGLIALVGLADRTGWLTRAAGALGLVLFALFAIEVYQSSWHSMQAGVWMLLVGSVVLIVGGLIAPAPEIES